jgi:Transposase DDE domain
MPPTLGRFGDARREAVGIDLLARLVEVGQSGVSVRGLGGDRSGEVRFGRFLHCEAVTPGEMVASASAHTRGRVAGRHILAIQDTTSLRDDGKQRSINLHPTIAVDAKDGALLGLVHAELLRRDGSAAEVHCNKRPFAAKESHRWLAATQASALLRASGAAAVTVVGDREGDIYEDFALRPPEVEVLFRAHHDRLLSDGESLFSKPAGWKELGRETITLPAAPGRRKRQVTLALRAGPVTLKRPKRNSAAEAAKLPATATVTLLEVREIDPPADTEPVLWRLLTSHSVETLAAARQVTGFYRQRWTIEQLFRTMKTKGFDIEAVRVAEGGPFENLATATLIAAIEVLSLVRDRDGAVGQPMTDVFEADEQPIIAAISASLEGRTARQRNPHAPGSLAHAAWVCARLGGWAGYYGKPGPVVMLQGLLRLRAMIEGWRLAGQAIAPSPARITAPQ